MSIDFLSQSLENNHYPKVSDSIGNEVIIKDNSYIETYTRTTTRYLF